MYRFLKKDRFHQHLRNHPHHKPDISKWNTNNVTDMIGVFYGCSSLSSLPDISKWNTNNVTDMSDMFYGIINSLLIPQKFLKF